MTTKDFEKRIEAVRQQILMNDLEIQDLIRLSNKEGLLKKRMQDI